MMPDPLDVAFAALGNDQAAPLLRPQLDTVPLRARSRGDARAGRRARRQLLGRATSTTCGWRRCARCRRTGADGQTRAAGDRRAREAWGRRDAEHAARLVGRAAPRHHPLRQAELHGRRRAASSRTRWSSRARRSSRGCRPTPPRASGDGARWIAAGRPGRSGAPSYFAHLGEVAGILEEMAEYQAQGTPFTAAHMAFINETVKIQQRLRRRHRRAAGTRSSSSATNSTEFDPTIADVHTQPTDEAGNPVGRVLHVGTGYARAHGPDREHLHRSARLRRAWCRATSRTSPRTSSGSTTRPGRSGCSADDPARRRPLAVRPDRALTPPRLPGYLVVSLT